MSNSNYSRRTSPVLEGKAVDLEVLPPVEDSPRGSARDSLGFSRKVADLLDRAFPVRGSGARFGLDPLIGLIPGVGDAISAGLGSILIVQAMRLNAPRLLVMRMAGNLALNATIGAIPLLGDVFSFLFKSNMRNYALLHAWQAGEKSYPSKLSRGWLAAGCVGLIAVVGGIGALIVWAIAALWKAIT